MKAVEQSKTEEQVLYDFEQELKAIMSLLPACELEGVIL